MFYLKLALSGVKSRLKEHMVLLFGLVMSGAIFYMFQTLAQNKSFLTANSSISMIGIIFQIGSFLLAIITFFYVLYANSFLLSLKQREFGLFQLLGIRKRTTSTLIFIETFVLGMGSVLLGSFLGTGLSAIVSRLLIDQLDLTITHYQLFLPAAFLTTIVFYGILFILAAMNNALRMNHVPILQLLNGTKQANRLPVFRWYHVAFAILAVLMNIAGYFALFHVKELQVFGIFAGMVLIVFGTYIFYATTFPFCLHLLMRRPGNYKRGLSLFTLGQLQFRIKDFSRTLATITILLALSLGAITVGFSFHELIRESATQTMYYDIALSNPTDKQQQRLSELKDATVTTVPFIQKGDTLYYNLSDIQKETFYTQSFDKKTPTKITEAFRSGSFEEQSFARDSSDLMDAFGTTPKLTVRFVSAQDYQQVTGTPGKRIFVVTEDFFANLKTFQALTSKPAMNFETDSQASVSRYALYAIQNQFYSGLTFMGFFLGIAFLVILASLFMFKILTGVEPDKRRYQILASLGVSPGQMRASIFKEIGYLFGISAFVGVLHVLCGLKMFDLFFANPYQHILWPFLIFGVIYALYYFVTASMYAHFVRPTRREEK